MDLTDRSAVATEATWDLQPLFASLEDWQSRYKELESKLPKLGEFRGRLGDSASTLLNAFELFYSVSRALEAVYVYAHLLSDQDTGNAKNLGLLDQAMNLYMRLSAEQSYVTPELLSIPDEKLRDFLQQDILAGYRRAIEEIVRFKPHTLSQEEENLLALGTEVFGAPEKIFSQLNNADLKFNPVLVDGKEESLSHGSFSVFLKNPLREVREQAFQNYYQSFDEHKNTLAAALASSVRKDAYLSRVKKYSSTLKRALFADNISEDVYDKLIESVSRHTPALHRYYELRSRVLGMKDLKLFDTYVPLVAKVHTNYSYEQACETVLAALKPLGEEYVSILGAGLREQRWVDRYENKGKRSGAYSSGCYDSFPYILLNYKENNLNDMFTLAHEAGHSMHSYFSCKHQSYQDHGYKIFVAEVASTFNEMLLSHHLETMHAENKPMLAYLINHQIDDIKATLYRQTMFAEFEKIIHQTVENNESLTVESLRNAYGNLLAKYFGPAVKFGEWDSLECLRIPHFYSSFYVYKYATGISAAITLARRVLSEDRRARDRFLNFLKSGGSKHPLDLLRDAGVDMSTGQPVEDALTHFASLVSKLEKLIA